MTVPTKFTIQTPRSEIKKDCKACGIKCNAHSGLRCTLCGNPTEHHGAVAVKDKIVVFADCLGGRKRMAFARLSAGVDLNEVDELALAEHSIEARGGPVWPGKPK